ncbi:hypothetical protein lbkm_1645 [Lachnospiraceae bacterium KM106-2]|nr:hypothetical protein lbkm_1645 [Lachnospiraceae bacterium KM106-2]
MDKKYIPALISLSAGFVICIVCIVKNIDIIKSLCLVLGFLLGFYLLGILTKRLFEKTLKEPEIVQVENQSEDIESVEQNEQANGESDTVVQQNNDRIE